MKHALPLLLCFMLLTGCGISAGQSFEHTCFTATVPEPFQTCGDVGAALCFAPYGDPLLSSSITFFTTEKNWYFDRFSDDEYASFLKTLCGYESLKLIGVEDCKVDHTKAKRIHCTVQIDQGTHDLVIYAIDSDQTVFFTLLNREGDSYIDVFDSMMKTVRLKEAT